MTGCSFCVGGYPPKTPMMVADDVAVEDMRAERVSPLPFGFGVLVGPKGAVDPADEQVPLPFQDPDRMRFLNGPSGPRMFLVTFSDPSPVQMAPPEAETEVAHVTRLGELYQEGRLHFVGHQASGKEGYMLLTAPDLDDAWDTARRDPLVAAGYFRSVNVAEIEGPYPWHRYGGPDAAGSSS
ncbi:YciI family protein [Streptomyces sp. NPDC004788]